MKVLAVITWYFSLLFLLCHPSQNCAAQSVQPSPRLNQFLFPISVPFSLLADWLGFSSWLLLRVFIPHLWSSQLGPCAGRPCVWAWREIPEPCCAWQPWGRAGPSWVWRRQAQATFSPLFGLVVLLQWFPCSCSALEGFYPSWVPGKEPGVPQKQTGGATSVNEAVTAVTKAFSYVFPPVPATACFAESFCFL